MADDLTAELAGIRERAEYAKEYMQGDPMPLSLDDVPRLLAAVEAVLELHQPHVRRQNWPPVCSYDNRRWPCPEVAAITRKITGKGESPG